MKITSKWFMAGLGLVIWSGWADNLSAGDKGDIKKTSPEDKEKSELTEMAGNITIDKERERIFCSLNGAWQTRDLTVKEIEEDKGMAEEWYLPKHVDNMDIWRSEKKVPDDGDLTRNSWPERDYVRWYGKKFIIGDMIKSEIQKGKPLFLNFTGACDGVKVWINGKYLGEHWGGWTIFEYNITKYVDLEKTNYIIVRLFYPKLTKANYKYNYPYGKTAGLREGARLIVKPKVFIKNALIDTDFDGSLKARVFINNTSSETIKSPILFYTLKEYNSRNIIKEGEVISASLEPGENIYKFEGKAGGIIPWSPLNPRLYDLELSLRDGAETKEIWKDTIGFRRFEVRGEKFFLNNKKYFVHGCNVSPLGFARATDSDQTVKPIIKWLKEANVDFIRTLGAPAMGGFLKRTDEAGMMVLHDSSWFASFTPYTKAGEGFYEREREELLEIMKEIYNHPSVVVKAISNEMYCPDNIPMINRLYDDLRRLDPYRPILTSTVKNTKMWSGMKRELSDLHTYEGWYEGPPRRILLSGQIHNQTHEYPLITNETVCNYLGLGQVFEWQRWLGKKRHKDPLEQRKQQARIIKIQMEIERMHPEIFTGGASFYAADSHRGGIIVQEAIARVYSPVFVCADIYNRNHFSGGEMENNLYCINDYQDKAVKKAGVEAWLTKEGDERSLLRWEKKEINLPPLEREVIPIKLTLPDVPNGFYTLHLALKEKDALLSENSYRLFIMKKEDTFSPVRNRKKRMLLVEKASSARSPAEEILKGLALNYKKADLETEEMNLNEFDLIISRVPSFRARERRTLIEIYCQL